MPSLEELQAQIKIEGDKVRQLKSSGASKEEVKAAVELLLAAKAAVKAAGGEVAGPPQQSKKSKKSKKKSGNKEQKAAAAAPAASSGGDALTAIYGKIVAQGNLVRKMKADKAGKADIKAAVTVLLALKDECKAAGGNPNDAAKFASAPLAAVAAAPEKKKPAQQVAPKKSTAPTKSAPLAASGGNDAESKFLALFEARARENEERIARLTALVNQGGGGGGGFDQATKDAFIAKLEQIEQLTRQEMEALQAENAKLKATNEKQAYRITHLVRSLEEAEK